MAGKDKSSKKTDVRHLSERGVFSVRSANIFLDQEGRLVEDPLAVAIAAKLGEALSRMTGMAPLAADGIQTLGTEGAYQIEVVLGSDGQVDIETNSDRPLVNWHREYISCVRVIRDYIAGRKTTHPSELGVSKDWMAVFTALAGAKELEFTIELMLLEDGMTYVLPVLSSEELSALKIVKEKDGQVNGRLCGVGSILKGHVAVWIVGQKDPIHIPSADEDLIHEKRKQGTLIKGFARYEEGKWILEGPAFELVCTQGELLGAE